MSLSRTHLAERTKQLATQLVVKEPCMFAAIALSEQREQYFLSKSLSSHEHTDTVMFFVVWSGLIVTACGRHVCTDHIPMVAARVSTSMLSVNISI
jgi:hypothetical protein